MQRYINYGLITQIITKLIAQDQTRDPKVQLGFFPTIKLSPKPFPNNNYPRI